MHSRRQSGPVAHGGPLVVVALRVAEAVALEVGHVAPPVRLGLVQHARACRKLVAERAHLAVVLDPLGAALAGPVVALELLPLRVEVPAERDRTAPQKPFKTRIIRTWRL